MELDENFSLHDYEHHRGVALKALLEFHAAIADDQVHISDRLVLSNIFDDFYFTISIDKIILKFELWSYIDNDQYFSQIVCKRLASIDLEVEYFVESITIDQNEDANIKFRGNIARLKRTAVMVVNNFLKKAISKEAFEYLSRPKP